jgi:hypothetical protein
MAVIVRVAGEGPALEFRRTNCLRTLLGDVGLSHRRIGGRSRILVSAGMRPK